MEIVEKDFKLTPVNDECPLFDLELLRVVKPRNGASRSEFKDAAYGVTLDTALKIIRHYRIVSKHKDDTISLSEFRKELKEEFNQLKELLS